MFSEVCNTAAEGSHGAMNRVPVHLLIDTDSFPSVLLVINFEGGAVGKHDLRKWCVSAELAQLPGGVALEKGDVAKAELDRLFCVVASVFLRVLADSK